MAFIKKIHQVARHMKRLADSGGQLQREAWRTFDEKQTQDSHVHLMKEDDGASWVTTCRLTKALRTNDDNTIMTDLWTLRPAERSVIKIAGKLVTVPRYDQAYGRAYTFSGANHEARELPPLLQPYMDFANQCCATMLKRDYEGRLFNMCFVNWYEDGHHYIGWHSDDERQLYKNKYGETLVFSISLGQQRRFLMKPRAARAQHGETDGAIDKKTSSGKKTARKRGPKPLCFDLASGDCLVMGGLCQSHYKHSVPQEKSKLMGGRINMTFRLFK